jgi:hypothetical protein
MTQENNVRLNNALIALYESEEFKALKDLVIELKETDGGGGYNSVYTNVVRNIDYMVETAGWIYDSLEGTPKRGLSRRQKLRKALGYTNP